MELSGGIVDRNLPANVGNMGSIPGPGRFHQSNLTHEPELLKPIHLELVLSNKGSHCNEKPMDHKKEKARVQQQ